MSNARNLADLLDSNGDVVSGALDNVPPSNDASALTTGTLPIARIADGDITAAKLGSTLDLSGKTVTLPAGTGGKVLQVQYSATGSSGTSTSTSFVDDGVQVSITPISASSKLYVTCFSSCSVASGYAYFRLLESVSSTLLTEAPWGNFSSSPQQLNSFTLSAWYVPGNTTGRTFKLQGRATSGTRYLNYAVVPNIVVMEIAA